MPSATNGTNGHSKSALCTVDEFLAHSYDYLIIGGGLVGLLVAARLTEDPNITVGVLEGGENRLDDKNVLTPSLFPTLPERPE
jgi:choline dehydrogenase-like flavoprotein